MIAKFYSCVILALCFSFSSLAQCNGTITLASQAEVDAFPSRYGCSNIPGSLEIFRSTDITNLDSLYQVTSVGTLSIESNPQLTDLRGLSNLTDVNNLFISSNGALHDLTGFSSLTTIRTTLFISANINLTSLHGLEPLTSVKALSIRYCDLLTDLTPLAGLTSIGGDLTLYKSNGLTSLTGLGNITSIGGTLTIESNDVLTSVDGLNSLTRAGGIALLNNPELIDVHGFSSLASSGSLTITKNLKLNDLDGLSSMTTAGSIHIEGNPALTSIGGLSGITTLTGAGAFHIINNPALSSVAGMENITIIPGSLTINGNNALINVDLPSLTRLGDLLISGNANLATLGVENLQTITGAYCECPGPGLRIDNNPKLLNLDGFSSLTSVVNHVELANNALLGNINGLSHLTSVAGMIQITGNTSLSNIEGLSGVTAVGRNDGFGNQSIEIQNNPALTSLGGLRNLGALIGGLSISGNTSLPNLDGLQKVDRIGSPGLALTGNTALTQIDALHSVTFVDGILSILNNTSLINLNGLGSVTGTGGVKVLGLIEISNNSSLQNVDSLSSLVSIGGADKYLTVTNNPNLTRACGLYPLLHNDLGCSAENPCAHVITISGNGLGVTEQSIRDGGPCQGSQCNGTITLSSQAEVDAFPSTYGCTTVSGTLQIVFTSDVTNLDSLYQLTNVTNLSIAGNSKLKDVDGLSHLTRVNIFLLMSNPELQDISGLSSLVRTSQFNIGANTKLPSLQGLEQLRSAGGLDISSNPLLTDLTPLSALTSVEALSISRNNGLTSLSGLGNIKSMEGTLRIESNAVLTNVNGLSNLTSTGVLWVLTNPLLANVDGFSKVTSAGLLTIKGNPALTNLNGFSSLTTVSTTHIENNGALTSIQGLGRVTKIFGNLYINNNTSLTNLNGLGSLTSIRDVQDEGRLEITGNTALQNVDSLSSLVSLGGSNKYLVLTNNPNLTRACGLYPLLRNNLGCTQTPCVHITISGNGPGVTEQSIRDGGPCEGINPDPAQPTNLVFSKVTGVTMRVSFTAPSQQPSGGYLILMRHHEAPFPEEGPVEGTPYSVGDVIGNSTIVVGTDLETTSDIVGLEPHTPYYFDIFSYTASHHYVIPDYLHGIQATGDPEPPRANTLVFSNVTDNTMTVSFTADSTADGYITVMRANYSSYPDEVPEDGVVYSVGNVIGNSTIVVGMGPEESNDIVWLQPDVDYFFEVLRYDITNGHYDYDAENPQSGHQRTNSSNMMAAYPNPFTDNITIPFKVREENTHVSIVIFDQLGRVVSEVTNKRFDPGDHEVTWDRNDLYGKRVIEGLYMYAVKSSEKNRSAQGMVVAK